MGTKCSVAWSGVHPIGVFEKLKRAEAPCSVLCFSTQASAPLLITLAGSGKVLRLLLREGLEDLRLLQG